MRLSRGYEIGTSVTSPVTLECYIWRIPLLKYHRHYHPLPHVLHDALHL